MLERIREVSTSIFLVGHKRCFDKGYYTFIYAGILVKYGHSHLKII